IMAWFYILPGITNGIQGYFRGIGDLRITLYSSLVNIGVRVLCEIPMVFCFHMGFAAIPWSYFIGWLAMLLFEMPLLVHSFRTRKNQRRLS
ncbi:MAG: MATE family efflux transporter, partial [Lactimicrobium massiliense]